MAVGFWARAGVVAATLLTCVASSGPVRFSIGPAGHAPAPDGLCAHIDAARLAGFGRVTELSHGPDVCVLKVGAGQVRLERLRYPDPLSARLAFPRRPCERGQVLDLGDYGCAWLDATFIDSSSVLGLDGYVYTGRAEVVSGATVTLAAATSRAAAEVGLATAAVGALMAQG